MGTWLEAGQLARLSRDVRRRFARRGPATRLGRWRTWCAAPQNRTLLWFRLQSASRARPARRLFGWLYRRASARSGVEIDTRNLGGGLVIPHWGRIFLDAEAIGRDLYVLHNVTIGNDYRTGRPTLGHNVFIGAGATVVGKITIGDNVVIGAGSLVTSDVPDNSLVLGNPGRMVKALPEDAIAQMLGYQLPPDD